MAAITIYSELGAPKNKVWHCFHCFPIYFPWSDGTRCHDLRFLNVEHQLSVSTPKPVQLKKFKKTKNPAARTSLEVQRLGLHASTLPMQGAQVQPLWELRGTKIPRAPRLGQNKKKTKPTSCLPPPASSKTLLPRSFSSSPEVHSQPQRNSCTYEGLQAWKQKCFHLLNSLTSCSFSNMFKIHDSHRKAHTAALGISLPCFQVKAFS